MELAELAELYHELNVRVVRLETEWKVRRQRETNMPGWIWAAISALTAVFTAVMWWFIGKP